MAVDASKFAADVEGTSKAGSSLCLCSCLSFPASDEQLEAAVQPEEYMVHGAAAGCLLVAGGGKRGEGEEGRRGGGTGNASEMKCQSIVRNLSRVEVPS